MWCSDANSYSLSDLERKISTPISVEDTRIQTREYGDFPNYFFEVFCLVNHYFSFEYYHTN